jgi:predicted TIM-barrel fold metal-dependent hydrolase
MSKVLIISSDGHAAPPLAAYRPYLESHFHEDLDQLVAAEDLRTTINFFDVLDPEVAIPYKEAMYDSGVIEGRFDVERRLHDVASEGVVAEVLFPDGAPFGAGGLGSARTRFRRDLELAGGRAYNRWLADFVGQHPERFAAQAIISLVNVDEAIADVYWAAEHGFKGLVMPGMDDDIPMFWSSVYEPFWHACEETGLCVNFHGGIGQPTYGGAKLEGVPATVRMRVSVFEFPFFAHRPLWFLIWSGVLERHPHLQIVFTEQHSDWVVQVIAQLDHAWHNGTMDRSIRSIVPHPPSYYFRRQVHLGSSVLARGEVLNHEQIGLSAMMFGADFPHPEGTWGKTLPYLRATVGDSGMSDDDILAFLGGNAAQLFGFNVAALQPVVDAHGWSLDEIRGPLDEDARAKLRRSDAFRPTVALKTTPVIEP